MSQVAPDGIKICGKRRAGWQGTILQTPDFSAFVGLPLKGVERAVRSEDKRGLALQCLGSPPGPSGRFFGDEPDLHAFAGFSRDFRGVGELLGGEG